MKWPAQALFDLAGVVFFGEKALQGLFQSASVHTMTRMISSGNMVATSWYVGVFEPIAIGVVGLLLGFALGKVAESISAS